MSQNGKGSKPRPLSISYEKYQQNWEDIFRKDKQKESEQKPKKSKDNQGGNK